MGQMEHMSCQEKARDRGCCGLQKRWLLGAILSSPPIEGKGNFSKASEKK